MIKEILLNNLNHFKESDSPIHYYFSPGRVNLIGEHTDYSGGFVFPMAIDLGIYAAVRREEGSINVFSTAFEEMGVQTVKLNLFEHKHKDFRVYIQAMLWALKDSGYPVTQGFQLSLHSTLPDGAGLSSSAALEMLIGVIAQDIMGYTIDRKSLALIAKKAENEFVGVQSGIMDQFAVGFGQKDHAVHLNTETLDFERVPFSNDAVTLVLCNTNKKRALVESAYNERFHSVQMIQKHFDKVLGRVSMAEWLEKSGQFDDLERRRGRHIVLENRRTLEAKKALIDNDWLALGELITQSHHSLQDDFEVSCTELDFLVEEHIQLGALGARMTGAGFGGTMLALYQGPLPHFGPLKDRYHEQFGLRLDIYTAQSSDSVRRINEKDVL